MSAAAANSLPCTGGCGCWTERTVEVEPGKPEALCIFCEDGIPCPAARAAVSQPIKNEIKPKARNMRAPAIPQIEEAAVRTKVKCAADGCETMTASKVGYCGKHFYMSKLKRAKPAGNKAQAAKKASGNGHAKTNGNGHEEDRLPELVVQLNESQMDAVLASLSLSKKAQLIRSLVALP
jgi:hypothetical protein